LGDDLFGGFEFVEAGGEPIGVVCIVGEKAECGQRGAGLRGVVGESAEVVAFEGLLEAGGEFVPLLARGEFIPRLDLGRGELVEELLAELEKFVGRGQRGLGGSGGGDRRGLRDKQRGREGEGDGEE
jgi:hypothetical protein